MSKYKVLMDGEWQRMRLRNQKEACCSCSLVHNIDFYIAIKGKRKFLYARYRRNNRATSAMRRHEKNSQSKEKGSIVHLKPKLLK